MSDCIGTIPTDTDKCNPWYEYRYEYCTTTPPISRKGCYSTSTRTSSCYRPTVPLLTVLYDEYAHKIDESTTPRARRMNNPLAASQRSRQFTALSDDCCLLPTVLPILPKVTLQYSTAGVLDPSSA